MLHPVQEFLNVAEFVTCQLDLVQMFYADGSVSRSVNSKSLSNDGQHNSSLGGLVMVMTSFDVRLEFHCKGWVVFTFFGQQFGQVFVQTNQALRIEIKFALDLTQGA